MESTERAIYSEAMCEASKALISIGQHERVKTTGRNPEQNICKLSLPYKK